MDRSPYDTGRLASADESLLVSPLLADFFFNGVYSNNNNSHGHVRKNLQSDIEDATISINSNINDEKEHIIPTTDEATVAEQLRNALSSSSPIEQSDDVSPNAANLLQLDTSFCPSLGFGSVGSSSSEEDEDPKIYTNSRTLQKNVEDFQPQHLTCNSHHSQSNHEILSSLSDSAPPLVV